MVSFSLLLRVVERAGVGVARGENLHAAVGDGEGVLVLRAPPTVRRHRRPAIRPCLHAVRALVDRGVGVQVGN